MVLKCSTCKERARQDGSCKTATCANFRAKQTGSHWGARRLEWSLGETAHRIGMYIVGGYALTLMHRHDIRVGVASDMCLAASGVSAVLRLEILIFLYPLYWRWPTKAVLSHVVKHLGTLMRAASSGEHERRAEILKEALDIMQPLMDPYMVVGNRDQCRVELVHRSVAKTGSDIGCFGYHPYSNPASRRTGDDECRILLQDVCSGKLWQACESLYTQWAASGAAPTYRDSVAIVAEIQLWAHRGSTYNRMRLMTPNVTQTLMKNQRSIPSPGVFPSKVNQNPVKSKTRPREK